MTQGHKCGSNINANSSNGSFSTSTARVKLHALLLHTQDFCLYPFKCISNHFYPGAKDSITCPSQVTKTHAWHLFVSMKDVRGEPPPPHKNSKSSWKSWTVAQWPARPHGNNYSAHIVIFTSVCCIILQVTLLSDSQCSKRIAWHCAFDRICGVSAAARLVSCRDPKPCNLDAQ